MKNIFFAFFIIVLFPLGAYAQVCGGPIPSTPTDRFTEHGDGTVTDMVTGLMWKVCSEGQTYNAGDCDGSAAKYTWQEALQQANTAGYAGHSDWRVPNIKELASIVELQCVEPAINRDVFPGTPSEYFWAASPYAGEEDKSWSWNINFGYGGDYMNFRIDNDKDVRLVRGGL